MRYSIHLNDSRRRSFTRRLVNFLFNRVFSRFSPEARWHSSDENEWRRKQLGVRADSDPVLRRLTGRWFNKRAWFTFGRGRAVSVEAQAPAMKCALEFTVNSDEKPVMLHVAIPPFFQAFIGVNSPLARHIARRLIPTKGKYVETYSPWSCGFSVHSWALWLKPWVPDFVGYGRHAPWWVRTHCFDFLDLLFGRMRHKHEILGEWQPVLVPMIEGAYPGRVRFERRTWWRPRLPRWVWQKVSNYTEFESDRGIPFPGKGENSWDCGMDGLHGTGSEDHDIPKCISKVVASVLHSRERYGGRREWIPPREEAESRGVQV